jgi:hypothetical protein
MVLADRTEVIFTYVRKNLQRARRTFSNRSRLVVERRDFAALDPATLRDLGVHRSEFDSYWAESNGLTERTRVRSEPAPCSMVSKRAHQL